MCSTTSTARCTKPTIACASSQRAAGRPQLTASLFLHGYGEAAPRPLERALRLHGPLAPGAAPLAQRQATHVVDASRMYLAGFSFGGNGVFDLASLQPGLWAALWAVDATRVPQPAPRQPVWLSAGELARAQRRAFIKALGLAEDGERVWADDGEDHVGSARVAYGDERIYRWLLTFSRP